MNPHCSINIFFVLKLNYQNILVFADINWNFMEFNYVFFFFCVTGRTGIVFLHRTRWSFVHCELHCWWEWLSCFGKLIFLKFKQLNKCKQMRTNVIKTFFVFFSLSIGSSSANTTTRIRSTATWTIWFPIVIRWSHVCLHRNLNNSEFHKII